MSFVKLDCNILNSSLWIDRNARECFITALCLARPHEVACPLNTIQINSLEDGDFIVSPGWYGFVPASGPGIAARAMVPIDEGLKALERLASPDRDSRNPNGDGRRMVRVDGGFIILNYDKYRQKDTTAAERSKRYRDSHKVVTRDGCDATATATQGEGEGEVEGEVLNNTPKSPKGTSVGRAPRKKKNSVDYQAFMDTWNTNTEGTVFPKISTIVGKRTKIIAARLDAYPNLLDMMVPVINYMSGVEFYSGHNKNEWKANFDYLMQDGKMVELYEKAISQGCTSIREPDALDLELAQMEREYADARR